MFRSLGIVVMLWYLSSLFGETFAALDSALTASLRSLEAAAIASPSHIPH